MLQNRQISDFLNGFPLSAGQKDYVASGLVPFTGRIQGVRRLFEIIVFVIFLVEKFYQTPDSKQDEAKGNHESGAYRKGL